MQGLYPIVRRKRVPLLNADVPSPEPAVAPRVETLQAQPAATPAALLPPEPPEPAGRKERRAPRQP